MNILDLISLVVIMTLIILYLFAYPEILQIIYKTYQKEREKKLDETVIGLFFISILLLESARILESTKALQTSKRFEFLFLSLGLFFTSITIFTLGLLIWKTWMEKLQELKIRLLLSKYSLWLIKTIFLMVVFLSFLFALVTLVTFLIDLFQM
ncbi:MAG: hypothetical protein ACE5HW_04505 [Candidatus Methanofastidiosia archaeon]